MKRYYTIDGFDTFNRVQIPRLKVIPDDVRVLTRDQVRDALGKIFEYYFEHEYSAKYPEDMREPENKLMSKTLNELFGEPND